MLCGMATVAACVVSSQLLLCVQCMMTCLHVDYVGTDVLIVLALVCMYVCSRFSSVILELPHTELYRKLELYNTYCVQYI